MKVPKIFLPEKDLEDKIKELIKMERNSNIDISFQNPTFEEIDNRITSIFKIFAKTAYGNKSSNIIKLKDLPEPYEGWISATCKNYKSEDYYCTLFDLKSKQGVEWRHRFLNSRKENSMYYFKPNNKLSVKGKLIKEGIENRFWWYILKTTY